MARFKRWLKGAEVTNNAAGDLIADMQADGDITALKLRIPTTLHHAYQNKIVLQRELISFAALASVANPESGLRPVLLAYADLLVRKAAERGLQMNKDQLANAALDDDVGELCAWEPPNLDMPIKSKPPTGRQRRERARRSPRPPRSPRSPVASWGWSFGTLGSGYMPPDIGHTWLEGHGR